MTTETTEATHINNNKERLEIGEYVCEDKDDNLIGQGAFGNVYKGQNKMKAVAIKEVDLKSHKLKSAPELITRETDILKKLSQTTHKNIVTLLHCERHGNCMYFVMELCNGGNLADYLQSKQRLDERTLRLFLRQIAAGLKVAHDLHIVHRDFKPENILLCFSGPKYPGPHYITLKIADFGIGRFLDDKEMARTQIGTQMYMAPEVLLARPYDYKVDLWSIGVIAHECLNGSLPAGLPMALQEVEIPTNISEALEDLLKGFLEKDETKRFDTNQFYGHKFLDAKTTKEFENCAIVVGDCDSMDVIKINLHRPNEITTLEQIPTKIIGNGGFAAVYCYTMYVTGVGDKCDEIWKYADNSGWKKCTSLVQGRYGHSAAFVDEVLYICGGFVENVIDGVEAYNAIDDKCATVGKLVHCVYASGNCVPFRSSLYIFGGLDEDKKELNDVQVYNTKQNTCTLLTQPMPSAYFLMRAVLWDTSVTLVGSHTCFIYNIETETWQERKQFKTDVLHFGLVIDNERIFAIGGLRRDDVRYVPLQNIIDDEPIEWKIQAKLPQRFFVNTYAKMSCFI